jgi:hypothetical protein
MTVKQLDERAQIKQQKEEPFSSKINSEMLDYIKDLPANEKQQRQNDAIRSVRSSLKNKKVSREGKIVYGSSSVGRGNNHP